MILSGILTNCGFQSDPFGAGGHRYSQSTLRDDAGVNHTLMWVNRDVMPLNNSPVVITDTSEDGTKIKAENDKKGSPRFRIYGTGISIISNGVEVGASPAPTHTGPPSAAQPARATRAQTASACEPMTSLISYGLAAVGYARQQGETSEAVLASVYGSAMFGYKEGRALKPEPIIAVAAAILGAVPSGMSSDAEDGDDIPF